MKRDYYDHNGRGDYPVRFVCVSPRHGFCGKRHVSLDAAIKHRVKNRIHRPGDIILRYNAPELPRPHHQAWLAKASFRPQPPAPLHPLSPRERARIPPGLFPRSYEG